MIKRIFYCKNNCGFFSPNYKEFKEHIIECNKSNITIGDIYTLKQSNKKLELKRKDKL